MMKEPKYTWAHPLSILSIEYLSYWNICGFSSVKTNVETMMNHCIFIQVICRTVHIPFSPYLDLGCLISIDDNENK